MNQVTDTLKDFESKYDDAVKTTTDPAVAPELVVAPDVPAAAATAAVNESFEEFGKNKLEQIKAKKETLLEVSIDIRAKFTRAKNIFFKM
jgi:hypothetical protein